MDIQSSTFVQPIAPPSATPPSVAYASFWRRLHAYSIDSLLITVICFLITSQFNGFSVSPPIPKEPIQALIAVGLLPPDTNVYGMARIIRALMMNSVSWWNVALTLVVSLVYNSMFIAGSWQATPGKRLFRAYVTHADGRKLTYQQAALRHVASGASTLLAGLPYLSIFFTREKLAPHDMLCETRVIIGRTF